ncbi:MAG: dihydrofolate reductase family protein [Bacteroidota bacterium]
MKKVVYYVAISVDGFIAGPGEDISGFVPGGDGVKQYQEDLASFDTVIMGRKTYEFGYQYGLQPGKRAYPHMEHYIFSESLTFDNPDSEVHVVPRDLDRVHELKAGEGTDIYLCGGGIFAGWLLRHELIDVVKLKLNPFIQGSGIPLFAGVEKAYQLQLRDRQLYEHGLQIMTYGVKYA